MRMIRHFGLVLALTMCFITVKAQEEEKKEPAVKFSGFVNAESIYDTRQTVTSREGEIFLYPKNEVKDAQGNDINAKPQFHMFGFMTRAAAFVNPIEAFGAKATAKLEVDLLGNSTSAVNMFRLRHAYINLDWEKSSLLFGQNWHPMFVPECFPQIVQWGGGIPVHVLSRIPQIRYTYRASESLSLSAAASMERDFRSLGPADPSPGAGNVQYQKNAAMPELTGQLMYSTTGLTAGLTGGIKTIAPRIVSTITDSVTNLPYSVDEKVFSYHGNAFVKLVFGDLTIKAEGIYGTNMAAFTMLGGYGVTEVNPNDGTQKYATTKTSSLWAELFYEQDKIDLALYGGYTQNLGADKEVIGDTYMRGKDIANLLIISPRVMFKSGKTKMIFEVNQSIAAYGAPDEKLVVKDTKNISNTRIIFSVFRFF